MSQHERQQFGLVYELTTKTGLQLGTSEQELLAAWKSVCAACAILVFKASPFGPCVLAVHPFESLKRGDEASMCR
jgi:hypothetical protein